MLIYHYTSLSTAIQILEKGELWLSAVTSAIDLGEYSFAADHAIDWATEKFPDPLAVRCFKERIQSIGTLYGVGQGRPDPAFYASFTILKDNATQWYAYGDAANGACLAFHFDTIEAPDGHGSSKMAVSYGQDGLDAIEKFLDEKFDSLFASYGDRHSISLQPDVALGIADEAVQQCLFVKSEGFKSEKEVRFCVAAKSDNQKESMGKIEYRAAQNRVIPYLKVPFKKHALAGIQLGPLSSHDTNKHAISNMLYDLGYTGKSASTSELKVR